jgi:hypothetical protein
MKAEKLFGDRDRRKPLANVYAFLDLIIASLEGHKILALSRRVTEVDLPDLRTVF